MPVTKTNNHNTQARADDSGDPIIRVGPFLLLSLSHGCNENCISSKAQMYTAKNTKLITAGAGVSTGFALMGTGNVLNIICSLPRFGREMRQMNVTRMHVREWATFAMSFSVCAKM